jgi:branched-chain amino acid transport system substrate-binding protein
LGVVQAKASGREAVAMMKKMPTDDECFGKGLIRADGRKIHPAYLFEVKKPEDVHGFGDVYNLAHTTLADQALRRSARAAAH